MLHVANILIKLKIFRGPGWSQGLLYKHLRHSLINWLIHPLVKISLWRRHALTVQSQGLLYTHLCHSLINWLIHPLVKISSRHRHAKTVQNGAPAKKQTIFFRDSKSWRESKWHYWFKSYGNLAEWEDFAYWWSCIGKGLPWSLRSRLVSQLDGVGPVDNRPSTD